MEALDAWFEVFTATPIGAVLMFLLVFMMRIGIDDVRRRSDRRTDERPRRRID